MDEPKDLRFLIILIGTLFLTELIVVYTGLFPVPTHPLTEGIFWITWFGVFGGWFYVIWWVVESWRDFE